MSKRKTDVIENPDERLALLRKAVSDLREGFAGGVDYDEAPTARPRKVGLRAAANSLERRLRPVDRFIEGGKLDRRMNPGS